MGEERKTLDFVWKAGDKSIINKSEQADEQKIIIRKSTC